MPAAPAPAAIGDLSRNWLLRAEPDAVTSLLSSSDPVLPTLGGIKPAQPLHPPEEPVHVIPAPQALTVGLPMLLVMGGIFYFRRRRQRGL